MSTNNRLTCLGLNLVTPILAVVLIFAASTTALSQPWANLDVGGGFTVNWTNAAAVANPAALVDMDILGADANEKKGVLIPRMTQGERLQIALAQAAQGLLVYQTDALPGSPEGFYYNTSVGVIPNWIYLHSGLTGWSLTGNPTATTASFLGTPTGTVVPLKFKVNGKPAGLVDAGLPANTHFGYNAGASISQGTRNVAVGDEAMFFSGLGNNNTAVGFHALRVTAATTSADANYNTAVGSDALKTNTTGSSNSALGYLADVGASTLKNATAIGANAIVSADNSLVLGSIIGENGAVASVNVGIGTSEPLTRLDILGQIKITDGTEGVGKVLTSDATGKAQWTTPASGNGAHYVGELFGGGVVFYVYRDAAGVQHGLIASLADLASSAWSNVPATIGPTAQSRWNGVLNTAEIIAQVGHTGSAAQVCDVYTITDGSGTYADWYLPSIDELSLMYQAAFIIDKVVPTGNFSNADNTVYWSSTETNDVANSARNHLFRDGGQYGVTKNSVWKVRAVRSF